MTLQNTAFGVILMVLATLCFSTMEVFVKLLSRDYHTVQILWARYAVQFVAVLLILNVRLPQMMRSHYPKIQAFRSVAVLAATAAFFFGYQKNGLVESNTIAQTAPIFVTIGAVLFLDEKIGRRRILSLLFGLVGALIVLQPGTSNFSAWLLLPLAGAMIYSAYALATRYVGQNENVWTSIFYSAVFSFVILCVAAPWFWKQPDVVGIVMLLAVGALGTLAQILLTKSYAIAEASTLAPIIYVSLIFASFWDYMVFASIPGRHIYLGALVIVGAGLYVWQRERNKRPS